MGNVDILVFGAHPDDAEIGMGGTIAKHTQAGKKVVICDLTNAEMSSNGTVESRKSEAESAGNLLNLADRTNLGLPDRGLFLTGDQIERIVLEIRKHRPRLVFAPYWQDRHPDHVVCSYLVQEAVFNAKLRNYCPQAAPTTVEQLYFYYINDIFEPDLVVDVSNSYELKRQSLSAYRTQFEPTGEDNDFVPTPINQGYLERVESRDRLLGQKHMVDYAEGFACKLPYRIDLFL